MAPAEYATGAGVTVLPEGNVLDHVIPGGRIHIRSFENGFSYTIELGKNSSEGVKSPGDVLMVTDTCGGRHTYRGTSS